MALTVKAIKLWRKEIEDRAGTLAEVLEPLAGAGVDLQVVMGYRYPGQPGRAAVELAPVTGRKATSKAQEAGLAIATIPALLVEGDNKAGLGSVLAGAIADAGISLDFLVAQVVGRRFSAVFGFANESEARTAAGIIRRTVARRRK